MPNTINSNINEFLSSFPKAEIIEILNHIDKEISDLHVSSSKDFLYFNQLLKDYYKRIKEISETNNKISTFFRKDVPDFSQQIKARNHSNTIFIENIDQHLSTLHQNFSNVYNAFDLMIVPFNNFKQNLITLKYILANLNLHLTYINLTNKDKLINSVQKLNNDIKNITANNDLLSKESEKLVQDIYNLKNNSSVLKQKGSADITEQILKLSSEIAKQEKGDAWPDNFLHRISTHSQNCFSNMAEIITNLQYHDIIRQKMEHIQTSQKELVNGLSMFNGNEINGSFEEQLKIISSIPEITEIQVAQLLFTNKDYQTSIEKITNKLIEVGSEMKALNNLYIELNDCSAIYKASFLNYVDETQNSYLDYSQNLKNNWNKTSEELAKIINNYTGFKNACNQIFNDEKTIREEIKIFEDHLAENGKNFSIDLMKRLKLLLKDLKLNSNSLKNAINNITNQINNLDNVSTLVNDEQKKTLQKEDDAANFKNQLDGIEQLSLAYSDLSISIASEITSSLKKIEYYRFFEQTVEKIVQKLNDINTKINIEQLKKDGIVDKSVLDKIERMYTMKSERDIHHKLTDSDLSINDIFSDSEVFDNTEDSDGEVELF